MNRWGAELSSGCSLVEKSVGASEVCPALNNEISGPPERYSVHKPKACSRGGTHLPSPFHYPAARLPPKHVGVIAVPFIVPGLPALCCAARLHRSSKTPPSLPTCIIWSVVHYQPSLLWRFKFARPWSILPDVSLVHISAIWYGSPVVHLWARIYFQWHTSSLRHLRRDVGVIVRVSGFFSPLCKMVLRSPHPALGAAVAPRLKTHHPTWWSEAGAKDLQTRRKSTNHLTKAFSTATFSLSIHDQYLPNRSTALMDPRRAHQRTNTFIDDIAEDDASLVSDGEEPDPDSMEGQAMALDRRDYNLQEEIADHERRVQRREHERRSPSRRLDTQEWQRLYGHDLNDDGDQQDVPVAGPSSMRPRSYPRSMPLPPLFLPDSRDPTPYEPKDPRDLTPFVPHQPRPPLVPRPPSSVPPPPLLLRESRDSTPFQPPDPRDMTPFVAPVYQPGAPFLARPLIQSKRKRDETPEEEEQRETVIRVPDVDSSDEDETEGQDDGEEPEREEDSALQAIKLEQNMRQFFDDTALLDSDEEEDDDEHLDDALEETAEDRAFIDDTDHHELPPRLVRASSDADAEVAAMQQEAAKYDAQGVAYQLELAQEEEEQEDRTTDFSWLDRDLRNITHPDWTQREVPKDKHFYSKDKKLYPTEEFEMYRKNAAALTHPHFTKIPQDKYLANRNRTRPSYRPPYPVMLDETPHKPIPQVPAQPFQGRPHLPLSHLEPGDWTLVPKHGLAFAISATEILVPNKTAQRPPPSDLDGSNDPPAPSKKQKRQKKPEKVEITPVPSRKRDQTEKPPLSKKLTAEQDQARKEKERYWEYHQVESEPLTREQLVAESQQTSALVLTASKPRLLRPVVPSIDDLVPFQPLRPLLQFLLPRRGEVHGTALAPGDFVVVINDKRANSFGTILLIRDTPQYGRVVKELDDTAGIIVTVRVPNVGDLQVPIEKCTRGRNRVPLASTVTLTPRELATKAMFLSYRGPLPPRPSTPPPPSSASGESEELWAPGPSRPPRLAPKWPETLPAESDGTWLASSKLLHKRLDVHIFGVLGAPGAISARVKVCEQGIGFVLLDKKPAGRSPQRENVKVYAVNGTLPPTAIPLFAVRPVRFGPDPRVGTTAQKALTMADSAASLCDIKERVVIIGPNIDGKNADFGEYAETIPEEKLDGEDLVRVRLWPSQRRETYHISSLCCSRNIPTQTPDSPEAPAIVCD
ncbi:hypothetical protein C8R43DRAFT_1124541 [Mycena crocata]|nr:hypothetical protein C8R43DRAFT_1124541 [Mycena crocata]